MPKKIVPLSAVKIDKAKPQEKEVKMYDGGGLFLLITPSGGKLWYLKYRFGGKEKKLAFGSYPSLSLEAARQRREDARKLLVDGVDPGEMKKMHKANVNGTVSNTFEVIAREWHHKFSSAGKWSPGHAADILHRLEKDIFPPLGSRPISEIKPMELLKTLERIASRVPVHALYDDYISSVQKLGGNVRRVTDTAFALQLRKVLPKSWPKKSRHPSRNEARRVSHYEFPSLKVCRLEFIKAMDIDTLDWK